MKGIDIGKDKVKKICDVLKRETLEPAKKEADAVVKEAELKAKQLISQAEKEAERVRAEALQDIEKEKNVFQSSLNQACKQALEKLKQEIEHKLFNPELSSLLHSQLIEPRVIADLIAAVVHAIEKEGMHADLCALIPKAVPAKEVNALLAQNILRKLKTQSVMIGAMQGGASIRIEKDQVTLDITEEAIQDMVAGYVRKDFREVLFRS